MSNEDPNNPENKFPFFLSKEELFKLAQEKSKKQRNQKINSLSPEEVHKIIHELQVHQIELEMQNEELRWAQCELEKSRERYFDLYELAPMGYFAMNSKGMITEANLTLAIIFGELRSNLILQPLSMYVNSEDKYNFYSCLEKFFETGKPDVWVVKALKKGGQPFWLRIEGTLVYDDGTPLFRGILMDVSDMKLTEEELQNKVNELQAIVKTQLRHDN